MNTDAVQDMTRDELNRAVAEKLGYEVVEYAAEGDWRIIEHTTPPGVDVYLPLPDYAHDLNAIWWVVGGTEMTKVVHPHSSDDWATPEAFATWLCRLFLTWSAD